MSRLQSLEEVWNDSVLILMQHLQHFTNGFCVIRQKLLQTVCSDQYKKQLLIWESLPLPTIPTTVNQ